MATTFNRTIWLDKTDSAIVHIIDQRKLPHVFETLAMTTAQDAIAAIADMAVRGAPLIGATGAYGVYLGLLESGEEFGSLIGRIKSARPTAVNLAWAVDRVAAAVGDPQSSGAADRALKEAEAIVEEDVEICRQIGVHGVMLIEEIAARKQGPVNVLTHCNAGSLATIEWGTATSPIYHAHERGIPVHVWVDETRPRNQGASLTAYELGAHGVPHTVIVDNAGGHLMQHGEVDLVLVGTDRTTRTGDVCNKIGTYLKALAASDCGVPFYVGAPSPSIDWAVRDGLKEIPIEERTGQEVSHLEGQSGQGVTRVRLTPEASACANPAFDVTPARLVTGLITERGICPATEEGLVSLFPEKA
ncbi:MAG: S-methyl-5-thioribose-1-phosphate isomerase [Alphaproteobacteria bacterium]|nr:MAG: S-methyl-5-thioribose-1-phosphate isomerase [Alphaproteobacteria bacterium]